jgi:hypothetical protein
VATTTVRVQSVAVCEALLFSTPPPWFLPVAVLWAQVLLVMVATTTARALTQSAAVCMTLSMPTLPLVIACRCLCSQALLVMVATTTARALRHSSPMCLG